MRASFRRFRAVARAAVITTILSAGCSQGAAPGSTPAAAPGAAPAAAPAAAETAASVVTLLEPTEDAFAGHIDSFRWSPVAGADGYHVRITSVAGRGVWESPMLTAAEARLPPTVSLEPEGYVWQVSAMKGVDVLATSPTSRFTVTP